MKYVGRVKFTSYILPDKYFKTTQLYDIEWEHMGEEREMCVDIITSERFAADLVDATAYFRRQHPWWDDECGWIVDSDYDADEYENIFLHSIAWELEVGELILE